MRYLIQAELLTELSAPVREHHIQLRLAPWLDEWQQLEDCTLEAEPFAEAINHRDGFGNPLHCLALMTTHTAVSVKLQARVQTLLSNPFEYQPIAPRREREWIDHSLRQAPRLWDFVLHRSALTPDLSELGLGDMAPRLDAETPLIDQVQAAMDWIEGLGAREGEKSDPPAREATATGCDQYGDSTDRAHLLITLVRSWGAPARFATGYLDPAYFEPDEDDEEAKPRPQTIHAWADVLIPGAGWRGFDPALRLVVDETYIRVAAGRDASDVLLERETFKGEGVDSSTRLLVKVSPAQPARVEPRLNT